MLENIFMALTNLVGLLVIKEARTTRDQMTIILPMCASFVYHLIEHHKHGMPGMPFLNDYDSHQVFLNLDRIFSFVSVCYFFQFSLLTNSEILITFGFGLFMMWLSECVYVKSKHQLEYMITHSAWHLLAYRTLHLVLIERYA